MDWLKDFEEAWESAEVGDDAGSGSRIPDGYHKSEILEASLDEEARAIKYKVGFPDLHERWLGKTTFLFNKDGKEQFRFAKRELACLGVTDVTLSNLKEKVAEAVGKPVGVKIVTPMGRKYSNIYFNAPDEDTIPASWG